MPAATRTTVSVRMYNVGFGDAFVVTVRRGQRRWKMLVDCGVHSQGQARPLAEAVDAVIADLAEDSPGGVPHLDVVVATHHHADHIAGFAFDAWEQVEVDEVWVPFVEDEKDEDARALRRKQRATAHRLLELIARRTHGLDPEKLPDVMGRAHLFAANSSGNDVATDRLLGRNGRRFATEPTVRYLPSKEQAENRIAVGIKDVTVHVLGPSRDPAFLKRMNPPKKAGWLTLDAEPGGEAEDEAEGPPLFRSQYAMSEEEAAGHDKLLEAGSRLRLDQLDNDAGLLAAAAVLEQAVNNTSIFFVLEVGDIRLAFPGDSQHGAWEHVLDDPDNAKLMRDVAFYKIGHHGSHNGTPKRFVEEVLEKQVWAMLPWHLVRRWEDTIPKQELIDALEARGHHLVRADAPQTVPRKVKVKDDLWSELTLVAT